MEQMDASSTNSHGSNVDFGYESTSSEDSYDDILDAPNYVIDKEMSILSESAINSFVVGFDDNWVVHVSSHTRSPHVTIKRFNLKDKRESKHSFVLDMGSEDWTLAKTVGRDRSILLASGRSVIRVGFLQDGSHFKDMTRVAFGIDAITWDEFGVDCYLLTNERRDVYWLSMHGKVNHLCSLQSSVRSAIGMTTANKCQVIVLDTQSSKVHTTSYEKAIKQRTSGVIPVQVPVIGDTSQRQEKFMVRAMASTPPSDYHFILFSRGTAAVVGLYSKDFDFLRCVVVEQVFDTAAAMAAVDIAVQRGNLVVLLDTRILMYKIPSKLI